MASADPGEELDCSLCLNLYVDPVTIPCGHNFCWICIDEVLDTQSRSGVYSCPECKAEFQERPALQENSTLFDLVRKSVFMRFNDEKVEELHCTYCIHFPVPAVKSCALCEASLCVDHLRVHSKAAEHVLTELSFTLEDSNCAAHEEMLEYYCTEDSTCTCLLCELNEELRGHQEQMMDEASEKKQKLKDFLQKLSTKREKTEERIQSLEEQRRKAKEKAAGEVEKVSALFTDMRRQLNDLEKQIFSEISRQDEQVSLSLSALIQKMEIKKDELSKKIRPIEELCNMTDPSDLIDPLTALQEPYTEDLCDPEEEGDEDTAGDDEGDEETEGHNEGSDWIVEAVAHISHSLSDLVRAVNVTFYRQGPADILLDITTAANNIGISDDLKTVSRTDIKHNRPETAKRFQYFQVMSRNSISSGCHYWDVKSSASGKFWLGMCYPSIDRRGEQSYIGYNNKSWSLYVGLGYKNLCTGAHDSKKIVIPHQISATEVRVYVDYEAGQLSFYELCNPIKHLHTFTATFSEPLHAALCVWGGCIKISGGKEAEPMRNHYDKRKLPKNWRAWGAESYW